MAIEIGLELLPFKAAGDLSTKQFYIMKQTTADGTVDIAAADSDALIGILQDDPEAAGEACAVAVAGVSKCVRGAGTITAGTLLTTDSSGRAIPLVYSDGDIVYTIGSCYMTHGASNAGEIISVDVRPQMFRAGAAQS